jgi:hypothetical protein
VHLIELTNIQLAWRFYHFFLSEGGFLDRGEELPAFSPVMPARAPPYADEEVEPELERAMSPPLYAITSYTEAQVSGKKLEQHACACGCTGSVKFYVSYLRNRSVLFSHCYYRIHGW